jgi:hypothetical protein
MAQTPPNEIAMADFHRAIKRLVKQRYPATTYKDVHRWAIREHNFFITDETIRRAMNGNADPMKCGADLLIVLMTYFDAKPEDLGEYAAQRLRAIISALGSSPDSSGGQADASSRCTVLPFARPA